MGVPNRDPMTGRSMTTYKPEIGDEICRKVSAGQSTNSILKELNIEYETFYNWLNAQPELHDKYREAKDNCAEFHAESVVDIAETSPRTFLNKDGSEIVDNAWVNNQKNRLEARKWAASMMKPKKYGAHQNITVDVNVRLVERLEKALIDVTPGKGMLMSGVVEPFSEVDGDGDA